VIHINKAADGIGGNFERRRYQPRAFTLLEVILAIAILGVSLAIIGEGFRAGLRNIDEAKHEVRASLVAESILSSVACGEILPENASEVPYTFDPSWVYSITSEPPTNGLDGLLSISVTVHHVSQPKYGVTMSRWLTDPNWLAEQAANNPLNQAAANASTTSSTSGSTSSSSSGSATGGSQ
jgi:general secretion pathway protein I